MRANLKRPGLIPAGLAMVAALTLSGVAAAQELSGDNGNHYGQFKDDMSHPLEEKRRAKRQKALEQRLNNPGQAKGKVHKVAKGQYVELEREGEELIWTVLGEFGELDSPFGILQSGVPGPLHNEIPEPDRSVDNSTIWAADFSRDHFMDLLFSEEPGAISMRNFYIELSANRYTVDGDITDWGQVPYNAAHYGRDFCGSIVCFTTWWFVRDSVDGWYNAQIASGKTPEEIDEYLSQFDVWDRYDHDGDGDFDEPDGYIDHFQSVHAGEGQETGGGAQGSDAIWSHRWYVQLVGIGSGGPTLDDGTVVPFGGTPVGGSKYWIGDYTVEPENGAVGVFAHEYAHDLGLPDLYDTAGNTSAVENSTAFWTLMSSGSYGNDGDPVNGIGTKPTHMGAWEKFQLGWLNYEVASAFSKSQHKLGPSTANTKQAQALFVVLPDKEKIVNIGAPEAGSGSYYWYSGSGDNLDNLMYKEFELSGADSLTARANFDIEVDWDYAYLVVSDDGGANWTSLETSVSSTTNPNGNNFGFGITGNSGGWAELTADLGGYSGPVLVGFRYWTDAAVANPGFKVDNIQISGQPLEDAEDSTGWSYDGFTRTDGVAVSTHFNAYVAAFRQYMGYDASLRDGPYNFGFLDNPALGNWVEHFPYQDGLLISYWDTSETDNNTSAHPGSGLILPIDAHPAAMYSANGNPWRARIQSYDSTFGLDATDAITLHQGSVPSEHPSQPAVPKFDDSVLYYNPETPYAGVNHPQTGTVIWIKSISAKGSFMQVEVAPAK